MQDVGRDTLLFYEQQEPHRELCPCASGQQSLQRSKEHSLCTGLREGAPSRNQGLTNVGVGGGLEGG